MEEPQRCQSKLSSGATCPRAATHRVNIFGYTWLMCRVHKESTRTIAAQPHVVAMKPNLTIEPIPGSGHRQ